MKKKLPAKFVLVELSIHWSHRWYRSPFLQRDKAACRLRMRLHYELRKWWDQPKCSDYWIMAHTKKLEVLADAQVSKSSSTDNMPVAHLSSPSVLKGYVNPFQILWSALRKIPGPSSALASWGETIALIAEAAIFQKVLPETFLIAKRYPGKKEWNKYQLPTSNIVVALLLFLLQVKSRCCKLSLSPLHLLLKV